MDSSADAPRARKRNFVWAILVALAVGLIGFASIMFLGVGRCLVVEDPLDKAPAIAVLSDAPSDPFAPDHWWRATGDALDVVREVLGLMNAWAGLPLQPSR